MSLFLKDPGAALDWTVDWAAGYLGDETIAGSEWSVMPVENGGIAIVSSARQARRTAATIEGGIAGHVYRVANRVMLTNGQADERSLTIRVEQR